MCNVERFEGEHLRFGDHEIDPSRDVVQPKLNRAASRVLRLLAWFAVLGSVVTAVAIVMPTLTTASDGLPLDLLLLAAFGSGIAAGLFWVVRGIRRGRRWARVAGMSFGVMALAAFPVGTAAGCHVLWRLLFRWERGDGTQEKPLRFTPD